MKQLIIFALIFFISQTLIAQQQLTLKTAIETALKNNLQVKQSELQSETAAVNRKLAHAAMTPDLFGNISHGLSQGRSIDPFTNTYINQQVNFANYSFEGSEVLFQGLQLRNNARASSSLYKASEFESQQTRDNTTLNVILAYLQVLSNTDLLTQSLNQAELSRQQVDRLEILNKDGAIPPAQFYDLRGQYANDQITIINNRNSLEGSRIALVQLMNVDYDSTMKPERLGADQFNTTYDGTPESIFAIASAQLAMVKATDLRKLGAQQSLKAAKGGFFPQLYANGSLLTNYSSVATKDVFVNITDVSTQNYVNVAGSKVPVISPTQNFNTEKIGYGSQFTNNYNPNFSVGLRIPFANKWFARSQLAQARINLKSAEYIEQTTRIALKQSITQAWLNFNSARERYLTIVDQVAAFQASFQSAEVRFNSGVITSVDYLVAKNNLDRANTSLITARYDMVLRSKILDYYQNKPLW